MRNPAGRDRREERARRGRRVEVADERRVAEAVIRDRGEERDRHPEDHRVGVDEEEPEDHLLAAEEAETVEDRARGRAVRVAQRWNPRQAVERDERRDERDRVDRVRAGQSGELDQQAGECGAEHGAEGGVDAVERRRRGERLVGHEPRGQRAHPADAEAEARRRNGCEHEEHGHAGVRQRRVHREAADGERLRGLRPEEERAPVEGVCDRAADERQRQQRDELRQREETERERRVGQLVDL